MKWTYDEIGSIENRRYCIPRASDHRQTNWTHGCGDVMMPWWLGNYVDPFVSVIR